MKQNERLLVYAVTGFLAVILVIAVLIGPGGRDVAGAERTGGATAAKGLGDLLGRNDGAESATDGDGTELAGQPASGAGVLPAPGEVTKQQPLVAADPQKIAAELLEQQFGWSRRDRTVRVVRARSGDSLESLVRRWCGARDPHLDVARALNEELSVLRVGQEVCVPWVDDAEVLAAHEANRPQLLATEAPAGGAPTGAAGDGSIPGVGSLASVLGGGTVDPAANATADRTPGRGTQPTFALPGGRGADPAAANGSAPRTTREYTVQSGDSLWRIADRTYGRQNAARMVREILAANPGLDERLKVGQKIVLPSAP